MTSQKKFKKTKEVLLSAEKILPSKKFLPSEWAKMDGKKTVNYLWYDNKMGIISEEEFNKINK